MDEEITWEAPEFTPQDRSPDWFWALGIIAVSLMIAAILFGNVLFAIVVLISAVTITLLALRDPRILEFTVNSRGIQAGDTLYPYSSIKSFWVENSPEEQKILLQSERIFMPYIVIPIEEVDPEEVRNFIIQYIPEEEHIEPISQQLMEYLGF